MRDPFTLSHTRFRSLGTYVIFRNCLANLNGPRFHGGALANYSIQWEMIEMTDLFTQSKISVLVFQLKMGPVFME